ncbi:hypothetical protein [Bradyrhizobium sp. Tv2a-2]|uniref:hypothetical protein n=1 Tax=Bradyrhizobium sp. Tv2a-2 TaxID=113395 RepID=UPI00041DE9F9|nr:hypothetical protein [Bradyrhizobium sp. Tv2a-2]
MSDQLAISRAEVKALFSRFVAELEAIPSLIAPLVVREGDTPNSIIVENFPQPIQREYTVRLRGLTQDQVASLMDIAKDFRDVTVTEIKP